MYNILDQLRDALCAHENALNELAVLENGGKEADRRLPLSQSLDRGLQTNAVIAKFIQDYLDDKHLSGLLNHRMKVAALSDLIVRATDPQKMVVKAYKMTEGLLP